MSRRVHHAGRASVCGGHVITSCSGVGGGHASAHKLWMSVYIVPFHSPPPLPYFLAIVPSRDAFQMHRLPKTTRRRAHVSSGRAGMGGMGREVNPGSDYCSYPCSYLQVWGGSRGLHERFEVAGGGFGAGCGRGLEAPLQPVLVPPEGGRGGDSGGRGGWRRRWC